MSSLDQRAADAVPRLLTCKETCAYFGGIDPSTLYRGIAKGRFPAPIHVGPNISRWVADECAATLEAMIAGRRAQ
jgi:predicted DNA-binding transcriptional regulator AlpA